MRRLVLGILFAGIGALPPVAAQPYRAPSGNCDAAIMLLEAARVANAKAATELTTAMQDKNRMCTEATAKAADDRVQTASRLPQRVDRLLMACPGVDDAMVQGGKMAEFAKTEIADAAASHQKLEASCRH